MPIIGGHHLNTTVLNAGGAGAGASGGSSAAVSAAAAAAAESNFNRSPWLFPTSDARDMSKYGAIALPAKGGAAAPIIWLPSGLPYIAVPKGRSGLIAGIGIDFTPNGSVNVFTQNALPFQLLFQLLLNGTPFPGDWAAFNFLPGSVSSPDPVSGLKLRETDQLALTVQNIGITVDTQSIGARIKGYLFGKNYDPQSRGAQ